MYRVLGYHIPKYIFLLLLFFVFMGEMSGFWYFLMLFGFWEGDRGVSSCNCDRQCRI